MREKMLRGWIFFRSELEGGGVVCQLSPTQLKSPDVGIDLGYSGCWDRTYGIRGREGKGG